MLLRCICKKKICNGTAGDKPVLSVVWLGDKNALWSIFGHTVIMLEKGEALEIERAPSGQSALARTKEARS